MLKRIKIKPLLWQKERPVEENTGHRVALSLADEIHSNSVYSDVPGFTLSVGRGAGGEITPPQTQTPNLPPRPAPTREQTSVL